MEKYHSDLERSNQDLEQFANIVAHDLKSPLRAISQHLTLINIKNKDLLDEKSKQSLNFAVEGAERMSLLIEALFDYARIGFSTPSCITINLNGLLENVKHDLSALIEERKVNITYNSLPEVYGDPILISQLFQNLIGNAIKYCKQTPNIHIDAAQEGEYWRISVKDNGIGIRPSQHKQIFTIFRRLHHTDEYPGIGLGLAICDRIIKQHGGTIGVDSEPGKGSCFYFTLPLQKKETARD
jgi:light-regulated signal transduction histidine kinase (bacteriophytochrome)